MRTWRRLQSERGSLFDAHENAGLTIEEGGVGFHRKRPIKPILFSPIFGAISKKRRVLLRLRCEVKNSSAF